MKTKSTLLDNFLLIFLLFVFVGQTNFANLAFANDQAEGVRNNEERPNVLFIAVDDLNDWVGSLKGHPQAVTPNMDRLADRGVLFTNAHCASPACNPSRAAVFTGLLPYTTNVWSNGSGSIYKKYPDAVHLPKSFSKAGYTTLGTGKLLHTKSQVDYDEYFQTEQRWSPLSKSAVKYTKDELASKGTDNPKHVTKDSQGRTVVLPLNRMPSDRKPGQNDGESFDWGPFDVPDSDFGDTKITDWAIEKLNASSDRPLFIGVGYYRPHIPLWAPKRFFDRFKDDPGQLPVVEKNDLADLSGLGKERAREAVTAGSHQTTVKCKQWKAAVEGYLACTTYVDHEIGRLLDALDKSKHSDNTIVVLWSDHGWHLGEKEHWGKWTGWERSTRVPMMIVPSKKMAAKFAKPGSRCGQPVGLIDLYPTLMELAGIEGPKQLDGKSLVALLKDPEQETDRAVVTTFDRGNSSIRTDRWRLIRYKDGSEELYDLKSDPNEFANLAGKKKHKQTQAKLGEKLALSCVAPSQAEWYAKYKTQTNAPKPDMMILNQDQEPSLKNGFESLFNGKDLNGWTAKGGTCKFEVVDGCIVGTCVPGSNSTYLCTNDADFSDFVFTCEMKWEADGNSGVMFRAATKPGKKGAVTVFGPQAEMEGFARDRGWSGGIYGQSCGGMFYPLWHKEHKAARAALKQGLNKWNRLTVAAKDNVVKTWVNGVPCAHWVDDGTYQKGFFGLQIHKGKEGTVAWKNLRWKQLGSKTDGAKDGVKKSNSKSQFKRQFAYVSVGKENRIATFQIPNSGKLKPVEQVDAAGLPGSMTVNADSSRLFVMMKEAGTIASYRILPRGKLKHLGDANIGESGTYLSVHPSGKFLFSAYYGAGKVVVHRINDDGLLVKEPHQIVEVDERPHAIVSDPSGKFVFVPHTHPNRITQFVFDQESGKLTLNEMPYLNRTEEVGPRHLWFHDSGKFVFGSDEKGRSITSYRFKPETGTLEEIERISSFPTGFEGKGTTSDIEVHPSGKFVFIANRVHNSIASFAIDSDSGKLKLIDRQPTESVPRSFSISPDGKCLIAAGQKSGKLAVFRIDDEGKLKRTETLAVGDGLRWVLTIRK